MLHREQLASSQWCLADGTKPFAPLAPRLQARQRFLRAVRAAVLLQAAFRGHKARQYVRNIRCATRLYKLLRACFPAADKRAST